MRRGKRYKKLAQLIEKNKSYTVEEAVKIISQNKTVNFDESVEVHVKLSIDPKSGEQQVRGSVELPHGTGKTKKIAVITQAQTKEAREAGADVVAGEEMIADLKAGKINFDILVATPEVMPKLAAVAKILGPRGLMPNPKTGTVAEKVKETVEALKKGRVSFKNDATGNIHQVIGRVSFTAEKLAENFFAFLEAVRRAKPAAAKGKFITSIYLSSTMGPSIRIQA